MPDRAPAIAGGARSQIESKIDLTSARFEKNMRAMADLVAAVHNEEETISQGGGAKACQSEYNCARGMMDAHIPDQIAV